MAAEAGGAGGDMRAGIGTRLRTARERKDLTILQAAEKMHVDQRILESLEAEDFAALGAPVYARGHLRHYAELVGESSEQLQELYSNATQAAPKQPDLTRIPRAEPESDSGKFVVPTIIGLIVVALIGIAGWLISLSNGQIQPTPVRDQVDSDTADKSAAPATSATPNPKAAVTATTGSPPAPLPAPTPTHNINAHGRAVPTKSAADGD